MSELLNLDEACKFLQINKSTLYNHVRTGEIPAFKMGRMWRFHRETLENWVKARVKTDTHARSIAR